MTATIIKKQHELPMMTAIDFLGPVTTGNQKSTTTTVNNTNNKPLPDLIRYLYNHEWKLLLEHLKQHPNEARYLMDEDVITSSTSTSTTSKDEYYGRTALHYACTIRTVPLQVIEALITAYPMATCYKDTTTGYYTPLHVACTLYKSSPELIKCLLQTHPQGIEAVHKRESSYRTPLQGLIHSNEFYITRLLQRQRTKKRQRGQSQQQQQQTGSSPAQLQQRKRRAGIEPTITEEEEEDEVAELVEEENNVQHHDHVDYLNYQDDPTFQSLWSKATYLVKAAYLGYIDDEDDDSSPIKKKKFRMLHACVSLPDCPLKLIELVLLVHPNQALQVDDDGYLPIQIVAKRHLISAIHHLKEEQQQQQQQQQCAILANHVASNAANAHTWTQSSMSSNSPAPPPPYLHLTPANSMDGGMKSSNVPPMTPMTPVTTTGTNINTPRGSASGKDLLYLRYSRSNESFSSTTPTSSPDKKKASSPAVLPVLPTSPSKRHSGLSGMFSKPKLLSQKSKTISGDGSTEQPSSSSPVSVTTNKHRLVVGTGTGGSSSNFDHNIQSYHNRDISNISGISMSTMGMPALPPHIQRRYWNGTLSNPTSSRISDSHKRQSEQSMAILWLLLSLSTASKQLDHSRTKKLLKKVCESSRSLNNTNKSSSSSDNMIGPLDSQHIRRVIQDLLFASPTSSGNLSLDERTGELAMFPWMIVPMRHSSPSKQNGDDNDDDDDDVKHIDREMQQIQNHLWNAIHQSKSHDTTGGDESLLALSPKSSWESGGGYTTSHTSRHHQQQHQRPPAVPRTHHQQQQSSLSSTTSHARSHQVPAETTPSPTTTSRSKSPVRAPSPSPLTNNNRTNHHHHHHTSSSSSGVTIPEDTAVDVASYQQHNGHHHHHHRHNSGSSATTSKRAEQRQDDESAASMSRQRRNHHSRKNQVAASSTTTTTATTGISNHKKSTTKSSTAIKSIGSSSSMGASSNGSSSKVSTTTIRNHNNNRMKKSGSALPPTVPKSSGTKVPLKQSSSATKSISSSKKSSTSKKTTNTATSSGSGRKHHHAF